MASSKFSLKLVIDRKRGTVLYAEAEKDFTDFLFSITSLPMGTVKRLLKEKFTVGSISNIYSSIEKLSGAYMQRKVSKNVLLMQKSPNHVPLLQTGKVTNKLYTCGGSHRFVADDTCAICPECKGKLNKEMELVAPPNKADVAKCGYVQSLLTYMVTDDLVVTPILSTTCGFEMLKKFNVNMGDLNEKVVSFGLDEGLKLLELSLYSKRVLTTIFLGEQSVKQESKA